MIFDLGGKVLPRCPSGKVEETFWHTTGAIRGECSALGLKTRATGSRSWFFDYHSDGRKRRLTLGSPDDGISFAEAQRQILIARVALGEGRDPSTHALEPADDRRKMGAILDAFLVEMRTGIYRGGERRRPNYVSRIGPRVEILREVWGKRPAESIKRADISAFLDRYNDRPGSQSIMQSTISALFGFAEDRFGLPHPARGMKLRGGSKEGERFLSEEELRVVWPRMIELGYPRGAVMLFALYTGRRAREIMDMEWSEVDLERRLHRLPGERSKNHRAHTLPLSDGALAILEEAAAQKVGAGKYVFHGSQRGDRPLSAIDHSGMRRVNADLSERFSLHDLRRTCASHLEAIGCPFETVAAVLNHTPQGVTRLYARSDPLPRMREWLDRLDAHYHELLA